MAKIIVAGDPIDGFSYIGPFASDEEAENYAEFHLEEDEFWICDLNEPKVYESFPEVIPGPYEESEAYRRDMIDAGRGHLLKP